MIAAIKPETIAAAAERLRAGELVVFPTETVYGLGADAASDRAVARIFEAKGRPRFNPLIAHVADRDGAEAIAALDADARRLADAFWPGPLTLAAPRRADGGVSELACAGLATVAVRAPAHPAAQALLRAFGGPVVAPSANLSGKLSPTTASAAVEALGDRVGLTLDGGRCAVGVESAIVLTGADGPLLLRPGGVALEDLERVLGRRIERRGGGGERPLAPGALESHYAPGAGLRLEAAAPEPGEAWLGFGLDPDAALSAAARRNLSPSGDPTEAAANLFGHLRALDAALGGRGRIAVAPVPAAGLGLAINDRLRRAAAPRERRP